MRILSFGEVLYDVFPTARHIGGAPMNFAAHAARQGATAYLVSAVGRDVLGDAAMEEMAALGIRTALIARVDAPTGRCEVTLDADGTPHYDLHGGVAYDAIPYPTAEDSADCLYFGTLALRSRQNTETLSRLIEAHPSAVVFVDVNVRPPHTTADALGYAFAHADILKISEEELPTVWKAVLPDCHPAEDGEAALAALADAYPHIRLWVLTRGEHGALAYLPAEGRLVYTPAVPTRAVSTVGAGDSFSAALVVGLLRGAPLEKAMLHAARVAAYVVAHEGAVPDGVPTE